MADTIYSLRTENAFSTALLVVVAAGNQLLEAKDNAQIPAERAASIASLIKVAEGYTITMGSDRAQQLELFKAPVLRYSDPVTSISDGVVLVWTKDGRPEAVMGLHPGSQERTRIEFQSLSLGPLNAVGTDQPNWLPREPGVVFKPVDGTPLPEKTAPERLIQMRSMLRSFSASISDNKSGREELRLLSQPVFRYSQVDRGIFDGGLFVFVRATNPELLVVVEAQIVNDKAQWVYSPARFTGRECELRYKDQSVWSHGTLKRPKDPAAAYFQSY